jgi:recombination protein RecA
MAYLDGIENRLSAEAGTQAQILEENRQPVSELLGRAAQRSPLLMNRTSVHDDFMELRVGVGDVELDANVKWPQHRFSLVDDPLLTKAEDLSHNPPHLSNVPVAFNPVEHYIAGIVGDREAGWAFLRGLIMQVCSYYSYQDVKVMLVGSESERAEWSFLTSLPHFYDDAGEKRFIALSLDGIVAVNQILAAQVESRTKQGGGSKDEVFNPHYIVVCANKELAERSDAIHAIAEAQKQGGIAAFIDAEHAFDRFYAEKLGVNTAELLISQPDNGEQALEIADNLIRSGAIDIIVIDSVAALTPKSEIEGDMGDSKVGLQARLMSQALRKLTATINKTGCCCIFINQLREKIGIMFGNPETTTGGNALKFYASVRLDIRRQTQIKDGDTAIGNHVKVKVVKNKVAPPFRTAEFDIMFGEGISKSGEIVDLGVEYNIIKKSGSWFSYGDSKLAQGRDSVKQLLNDNPELSDEIEAKIREAIKENMK